MGRWTLLVLPSLFAFAAPAAFAQDVDEWPGGEPVVQQPVVQQPESSIEELHEDVTLLRSIRTLDLSAEQRHRLLQINRPLAERRTELVELRERTWENDREAIEGVIGAWMDGRAPSARHSRAADAAVDRVQAARQDYLNAVQAAGESFFGVLSDNQRRVIEGPAQAHLRNARTARMGGVEAIGEWVLIQLDGIRDLMPDEFRMLAEPEAVRIARTIFGEDAPNLPAIIDRVLDILVQVQSWPPERYGQQREHLPQQIEASLGVEGWAERPPIEWNEVLRLVRSTRTPVVVAELSPDGGGEEQ